MANEITASASLRASKGGATITLSGTVLVDMTGADLYQATQEIGTGAETVSFGDITGAPAYVYVENLDTTNYVEFGGDVGLTVFKLRLNAGECMVLHLDSATLYAKADTAAVNIFVGAAEA